MAVYTAIDDAGSFYSTKLYTGTGSSLAITGAGFQPDFTWIKNRDASDFNVLTDAVRGATEYLISNTTASQVTNVESLKSFDSDGFTVGTQAEVNTNTEDYVSWNWKMGTTTGIAGSADITPNSYSFNQTAGQSIIQYTGTGVAGATVLHGLGVVPQLVIVKRNDGSGGQEWCIYYEPLGNTKHVAFDSSLAAGTATTRWNDTTPTSTVFSIGTDGQVNTSSDEYVAYCFTNIQGYSRFGKYLGNGNTDGAYVYTGFRPAFVMTKKTYATSGLQGGDWYTSDNKRPTYNVSNLTLAANSTAGDYEAAAMDILSNGFKLRTGNAETNGTGSDIVYMAFAEAPFVNSSGVPVNAR